MSLAIVEIYPRVLKSNTRQTVYVRISGDEKPVDFMIKIQPMEKYSVPHTARYRIDEEDRYPYTPLNEVEEGLYAAQYDFTTEQIYSVRIKNDGYIIRRDNLYSVDEDLAALKVYKGDTHLHTNRSDGKGTPFEVACEYRRAGFDFIAVTDHHRFTPSLEAQEAMGALTEQFHVFRGEEVHNKGMGYFHIINFDGERSINEIIETDDAYVETAINDILATRAITGVSDPRQVAWRIFVANEIRKANGVAIMAHPFWDTFGEYHMETDDFVYHWKNGNFDALEVVAACDGTGNGTNLQEMLRTDMLAEGVRIPVVGASDAHNTEIVGDEDYFNLQFTLAFAKDFTDIKTAVVEQRAVAVQRRDDQDFRVVGPFRYAKYARYLMKRFYPTYAALTARHADALKEADGKKTPALLAIEKEINEFTDRFFAV